MSEIAYTIGQSKSRISRVIKINKEKCGYQPKQASGDYLHNHLGCKKKRVNLMNRANKGEIKPLVDQILMNTQLLLTCSVDSETLMVIRLSAIITKAYT